MRSELRSIEEGQGHAQHLNARRALRVCLHGLTQARPPPHLHPSSTPPRPGTERRQCVACALSCSASLPHCTCTICAPSLPSAGGAHCGTVAVAPHHLCTAPCRHRDPLHLGVRLQALSAAAARPSPRVSSEYRATRHRRRLYRLHAPPPPPPPHTPPSPLEALPRPNPPHRLPTISPPYPHHLPGAGGAGGGGPLTRAAAVGERGGGRGTERGGPGAHEAAQLVQTWPPPPPLACAWQLCARIWSPRVAPTEYEQGQGWGEGETGAGARLGLG